MIKKHMTPEDIAQHLEELQRPPIPVAKPDDSDTEGPAGSAGVPSPLRPLVPTRSGSNAKPLPDSPDAEQPAV